MAYTRLQMKLSVVIPTLDEAANISVLLERLSETPGIYEVVVADGGSADGTEHPPFEHVPAGSRREFPSRF